MRILGKVWRLAVAVKDGLVLIFMLLFFMMLYAALTAKPYASGRSDGALLLDIAGTIVEQPTETDAVTYLSGTRITGEYRLRDLVHAIDTATGDARVKAIALDLDTFTGGGQAALSDVGAALERARKAGKPVIAYASGYTDAGYRLAAHASEIWLNPLGAVVIAGPGGTGLYYKGLLDKLGVTANVYRVGTYKAAVEPFIREDMSPEAREANQALAASLWESWLQDVTQARPKAKVAAYAATPDAAVAAAGGDMARAALDAGLVDKIGDRTRFGARIAELAGAENDSVPGSFKTIDYDSYVGRHPANDPNGAIGVLTVAGDIIDGESQLGTAGAETIVDALQRGLAEKSLKALVVRIDSPGGSVLASERIRQAVLAAKASGLPVTISMGSVAASGGYWIATTGDRIFAEPDTITGSIGVFGIIPSFEGTLEKIGVGADGVKTTPLSGEPDLLRGPSPLAGRLIQQGVEGTYRRFLQIVGEARKLPVDRVDQIAQGRVWDGGTARQIGLVDQFGSFDAAFADAARRGGIDPAKARAVYLEKEPGIVETLLKTYGGAEQAPRDVYSRIAGEPRLLIARAAADVRRMLAGPALQARCLECPPVAAAPAAQAGGSLIEGLLFWWR